jgi:hypothetical protein
VACEFEVPLPPMGQMVDLNTVLVDYYPSNGGQMTTFSQVPDASACTPTSFYIANNKIVLCPQTCTAVKADTQAKVKVLFDCTAPLS